MDDMSQYKEIYAEESSEHLQSMNEALLSLENEPGNSEHINVMFRAAHTLKGMSATMGYTNIAALTHAMENLMDRVRNNEIKLDNNAIDVLFECLDTLEKMAEEPENHSRFDVTSLLGSLLSQAGQEPEDKLPAGKQPGVEFPTGKQPEGEPGNSVICEENEINIQDVRKDGFNIFKVTVTLHESCVLKSARSAVAMRNISEHGTIIETEPSVEDIENERFDFEFKIIVSTKEDARKIETAVNKVSEIAKVDVKPLDTGTASSRQQDENNNTTNNNDNNNNSDTNNPKSRSTNTRAAIKNVQSVRVGIERLDSLMNLVEELVICKIRMVQLANTHKFDVLDEALTSLNRVSTDLQEEVMAVRMVPIEMIFNRFPRMIRDLAKKEGKEIELVLEGGDIELDRTVLDEVGDPLVHILRNCVDHGIETAGERKKQGKNPKGLIKLSAMREKNHVIIEAEDDGKGMDPGKLRESAVKKKLLTEEEVSRLTDEEAINLSFMAGFSTNSEITDVSGRGVGMDVVKTKIESLGGSVKLESVSGEGTKITLILPLTIAITQSLMVKVSGATYAIPITNVIRDMVIKKEDLKTIQGEEVVLVRGEVLPIVRLNRIFGSNGHDIGNNVIVVVVEIKGSHVGLVVDELIGQQEVIIKNLDNRFLKRVKGFAGATILGDGNVALILDVGTIL